MATTLLERLRSHSDQREASHEKLQLPGFFPSGSPEKQSRAGLPCETWQDALQEAELTSARNSAMESVDNLFSSDDDGDDDERDRAPIAQLRYSLGTSAGSDCQDRLARDLRAGQPGAFGGLDLHQELKRTGKSTDSLIGERAALLLPSNSATSNLKRKTLVVDAGRFALSPCLKSPKSPSRASSARRSGSRRVTFADDLSPSEEVSHRSWPTMEEGSGSDTSDEEPAALPLSPPLPPVYHAASPLGMHALAPPMEGWLPYHAAGGYAPPLMQPVMYPQHPQHQGLNPFEQHVSGAYPPGMVPMVYAQLQPQVQAQMQMQAQMQAQMPMHPQQMPMHPQQMPMHPQQVPMHPQQMPMHPQQIPMQHTPPHSPPPLPPHSPPQLPPQDPRQLSSPSPPVTPPRAQHDSPTRMPSTPSKQSASAGRGKRSSLVLEAKEQAGSRRLQGELLRMSDTQLTLACEELSTHLLELSTHVFGNYVVSKLAGRPLARSYITRALGGHVVRLLKHPQGSRVVQAAFASLPTAEATLLVGELNGHVVECSLDTHGSWGICAAFKHTRSLFILEQMTAHIVELAEQQHGVRVVQSVLSEADAASMNIAAAVSSLLNGRLPYLASHAFGNYAVQSALRHGSEAHRQAMLNALLPELLALSSSKHGSNVAEMLLSQANAAQLEEVRAAVFDADRGPEQLRALMASPFGNYVVTSLLRLLDHSKRGEARRIVEAETQASNFGRAILAAVPAAA